MRFPAEQTWATPIKNVGTDTREYDILAWTENPGVLKGAFIPFATNPLEDNALAFDILATSVIGSIAEHAVLGGGAAPAVVAAAPDVQIQGGPGVPLVKRNRLPPALRDLQGAFHAPILPHITTEKLREFRFQGLPIPTLVPAAPPPSKGSYEARVMQGIWAAAPYLHNGSVPTLAELLKPAAERVKQFKIGAAYDTINLGLAVEQSQFKNDVLITTDCTNFNSGNSRCGHEFGTTLTEQEKKALLEYLKTL